MVGYVYIDPYFISFIFICVLVLFGLEKQICTMV